jgi:hypothetical protein
MGSIFLGPVRFWAIWIAVLAALYWAGGDQLHVSAFSWFLAMLGGLAAISVLAVALTAREGERITRDRIEPDAGVEPDARD